MGFLGGKSKDRLIIAAFGLQLLLFLFMIVMETEFLEKQASDLSSHFSTKASPKYIFVIKVNEAHRARTILKTWLDPTLVAKHYESASFMFFTDSTDVFRSVSDLEVPVEFVETITVNSMKKVFRSALHRFSDALYFVFVDDLTLVYPKQLLHTLSSFNYQYGGFILRDTFAFTKVDYASKEAGIVFSAPTVELLLGGGAANTCLSESEGTMPADAAIGKCLQLLGIIPSQIDGMFPTTPEDLVRHDKYGTWPTNYVHKTPNLDHFGKPPATYHNIDSERAEIMFDEFLQPRSIKFSKNIHQIWLGKDRQPVELMQTCKNLHSGRGWKYQPWYAEQVEKQLLPNLINKDLFDKSVGVSFARQADILRLELLYFYGGFYIDADVLCLRSFDSLLTTLDRTVILAYESEKVWGDLLANSIIGAQRYSHSVLTLIHNLKNSDFTLPGHETWIVSGPKYFTKTAEQYPLDLQIKPSSTFYPYHWTDIKTADAKLSKAVEYHSYTHQLWGTTFGTYDKFAQFKGIAAEEEPEINGTQVDANMQVTHTTKPAKISHTLKIPFLLVFIVLNAALCICWRSQKQNEQNEQNV